MPLLSSFPNPSLVSPKFRRKIAALKQSFVPTANTKSLIKDLVLQIKVPDALVDHRNVTPNDQIKALELPDDVSETIIAAGKSQNLHNPASNQPTSQAEPPREGFRFFDLPQEIRDQIILYVFIPGHVKLEVYSERWGFLLPKFETACRSLADTLHMPGQGKVFNWVHALDKLNTQYPDPCYHKIGGCPSVQQPGFQLMATCKSLYEDAYPIFYARNTFYLPPGPIAMTAHYFEMLNPKHRTLIRSLVLTFTVADLTPEGFQRVEYDVAHYTPSFGESVRSMERAQQVVVWTNLSVNALEFMWRQKLAWLLTWPTICRVTLRGDGKKISMRGKDMERVFTRLEPGNPMNDFETKASGLARLVLTRLFESCSMKMETGLLSTAFVLDVEKVKRWLNEQGPGLRLRLNGRDGLGS